MALVDWIGQFWSLVFRIESAGAIVLGIVTAVLLASTRAMWGKAASCLPQVPAIEMEEIQPGALETLQFKRSFCRKMRVDACLD